MAILTAILGILRRSWLPDLKCLNESVIFILTLFCHGLTLILSVKICESAAYSFFRIPVVAWP